MRGRKDLVLPKGFFLRQEPGTAHLAVLRPDGTPLRLPGGMPVKVACSPSDWRTAKNEQARIRKALK